MAVFEEAQKGGAGDVETPANPSQLTSGASGASDVQVSQGRWQTSVSADKQLKSQSITVNHHQSIYLSIYLSIYQSINQSITVNHHQSIYLSIYLSINHSQSSAINQSIYLSINQSITVNHHQAINQSINHQQSITIAITINHHQSQALHLPHSHGTTLLGHLLIACCFWSKSGGKPPHSR
jgi:hypothetical protein